MKRNLLPNRMITLLLVLTLLSCSENDSDSNSVDNRPYSGTDISSYFELESNPSNKITSVSIKETGDWKLYAANASQVNFDDTPILQGVTKLKVDLSNTFQIYGLEWCDGSHYTKGLRQLPLTGQANFRDMGGYKSTDGRRVKWGMLFRSGDCYSLTEADQNYLSSIPLKTVIDFRAEGERMSKPDKLPETVKTVKYFPIDQANLSSINVAKMVQEEKADSCRIFMIESNESLITKYQDVYKAFFSTIMDTNNSPVMFHCSAGKDRAGLAAALFLTALGVDKQTILQDYMLTNKLTNTTLENMEAIYGKTELAKALYNLYSVQLEYIEKAFSTIEKNYGSTESFLTKQLGVDINKLKELYLY